VSVPVVETLGLSRQYRVGSEVIHALTDLDLQIERGEFLAIMGASGSGKSTCLHLLGCLLGATSGSYRLDGVDVTGMTQDTLAGIRNRMIGFVFQAFHLQARTSARRNVELPLVYAGLPRRQRKYLAEQALCAVGLSGRLEHHPAQLSGGEMQRVAIARALVHQPRLLLTDEPTGALDSGTGAEIMRLLAEVNERGVTVVLVTHDEQLASHADRIVCLRDGKLIGEERQ
jgi:putative ABC transport system ATP-binding protein